MIGIEPLQQFWDITQLKRWLAAFYNKLNGLPLIRESGSETLSSGTVSVTFGTAQADTSYQITLSWDANETLRWGSKATTGFTITSSNGSSTANVDWTIAR